MYINVVFFVHLNASIETRISIEPMDAPRNITITGIVRATDQLYQTISKF